MMIYRPTFINCSRALASQRKNVAHIILLISYKSGVLKVHSNIKLSMEELQQQRVEVVVVVEQQLNCQQQSSFIYYSLKTVCFISIFCYSSFFTINQLTGHFYFALSRPNLTHYTLELLGETFCMSSYIFCYFS